MTRMFVLIAFLSTAVYTQETEAFPGINQSLYIALSVSDVEKAAQWYESMFALRRLDDQTAPNGSWRIINLKSQTMWVELIWDRRDQAISGARGIVKSGFFVDNVDDVAAHVVKLGGPRPRIIEDDKHRLRVLQLTDPDGNILQFNSTMK